ncbi:MAG: LysM peptidoglycan-binding domain-containing protein [Anaerolineaceae bacterium]|nr:LysM peptidoglycan-binding domain-containing protein [Anaerolineaceae bacterium]
MNRAFAGLFVLTLVLSACAQDAPPATATSAATPTSPASATPRPATTPVPAHSATIILPVTSTLPPVTLVMPATVAPTACTPRPDWGGSHVIQSGDSLFVIAQTYGLTVSQLQSANCIEDADFIQAGQVLRIPGTAESITPTADPTTAGVAETATPLLFSADSTALLAGECTILRWEIENVDAVFFDGVPVSGRGIREVCPEETTRYTLLVLYSSGEQEPFIVVVETRPA